MVVVAPPIITPTRKSQDGVAKRQCVVEHGFETTFVRRDVIPRVSLAPAMKYAVSKVLVVRVSSGYCRVGIRAPNGIEPAHTIDIVKETGSDWQS